MKPFTRLEDREVEDVTPKEVDALLDLEWAIRREFFRAEPGRIDWAQIVPFLGKLDRARDGAG